MNDLQSVQFEVVPADRLSADVRKEIVDLCSRAYEEEFEPYLALLQGGIHVLGRVEGHLATHAMWVTRWLQLDDDTLLKTAYIEAVATDENFRRRGLAAAAMQRVASEIADFDIAGLAPFSQEYYARLGWETWRGPLLIRQDGTVRPTPPDEDGDEECLMILRLPKTPTLDLESPISIEWREGEVW